MGIISDTVLRNMVRERRIVTPGNRNIVRERRNVTHGDRNMVSEKKIGSPTNRTMVKIGILVHLKIKL